VQTKKRSSGDTPHPKTQLGTDNRDSESIFGKLGEKSGLGPGGREVAGVSLDLRLAQTYL
jgi:hypothetical protein